MTSGEIRAQFIGLVSHWLRILLHSTSSGPCGDVVFDGTKELSNIL